MVTGLVEVKRSIEVGGGVCTEGNAVDAVAIALVGGVWRGQEGWVGRVDRSLWGD